MAQRTRGRCWAGTSGLILPVPNKAAFPEAFRDRPRLTYYSSLFNSIEINSSFYKVPMPVTFEKWAAAVPDYFRFTVKLGRHITHEKDFLFNPKDVDNFMLAANRLGTKKGCLLIQLPPSLQYSDQNTQQLHLLLQRILQSDPSRAWRLAVEFRDSSWYIQPVTHMLDGCWTSIVLQDMPASAITIPNDNGFVYIRLHGPAGDYKGGYSDDDLQTWSKKIKAWMAEGKDVFVYFNNTIGDAISNCHTLVNDLNLIR